MLFKVGFSKARDAYEVFASLFVPYVLCFLGFSYYIGSHSEGVI